MKAVFVIKMFDRVRVAYLLNNPKKISSPGWTYNVYQAYQYDGINAYSDAEQDIGKHLEPGMYQIEKIFVK